MVLDDKTYVKADFTTLPGPQYYTKFVGETLPESATTIGFKKFGKKYLVWQAISSSGLQSDIFVTEGEMINKDLYVNECLKRLISFIRKLDAHTLFWPDLAPAHYAKVSLKFMKDKNINFVPKDMNPPNVPQCRPIERYWALVKAILKKTEGAAEGIKDFEEKWKRASEKVDKDTIINLFSGVQDKLKKEWNK